MSFKYLLGFWYGILIKESAVLAFVEHSKTATTTLNRGTYSSSEIFSADTDLTDLLSKTDYGAETGKQLVKTTGSKVTDIIATNSPVPEPFSTVKSSLIEAAAASEDGKALPLGSFIKATLTGDNAGSGSTDSSGWDTAAANFGLMTENIFGLFGKESPRFLSEIQLPTNGRDSISQYINNFPESAKPWLAVATGATILIIGSNANKNYEPGKLPANKTESIQVTSDAIGSLGDELVSLQSRMKSLEANGLDLDSKLMDATSKLTQKELDISKERLKAADTSLNLSREIEFLRQKLKENDDKVIALDTKLAKARAECDELVKELDKRTKEENVVEVSSKAIKEEQKVNKKKQMKSKKENNTGKTKQPSSIDKTEASASTTKASKKKVRTAPKNVSARKKTAKKEKIDDELLYFIESPKKIPKKVDNVELPTSDTSSDTAVKNAQKKKSRPKKKGVVKVKKDTIYLQNTANGAKQPAKKETKNEEINSSLKPSSTDFTTLSKSALSRKTVKELREFLESKGVPIIGEDGKLLRKNGLLEAVRSL